MPRGSWSFGRIPKFRNTGNKSSPRSVKGMWRKLEPFWSACADCNLLLLLLLCFRIATRFLACIIVTTTQTNMVRKKALMQRIWRKNQAEKERQERLAKVGEPRELENKVVTEFFIPRRTDCFSFFI